MIVIAEKINATRSAVREIIEQRDEGRLEDLAQRQVAAGAAYIDVNVGTGNGTRQDEIESMQWAVSRLLDATDKPLCIDSADAAVLEAGLAAMGGRPAMINSTKADVKYLSTVMPLAQRYEAPVVALAMDGQGIPGTVEGRLNACRAIAGACRDYQVPLASVFFDPLVLPVATDAGQGKVTLNTLAAIKAEFPEARTVMGLSNISFGLPGRPMLNAAFLQMAIYAGLDAAIMDPLNADMMQAARTGDALMGKDRHFRKYSRALRRQ
ncbi:MAG: dihydropteroate synthase [Desulfatitalea sp.]|nr:dihydropteroate synthase [Desulfatitalea sp.]NNK01954.1 dihydropteroate synthase [Desulfatitalea sp.]